VLRELFSRGSSSHLLGIQTLGGADGLEIAEQYMMSFWGLQEQLTKSIGTTWPNIIRAAWFCSDSTNRSARSCLAAIGIAGGRGFALFEPM